jgi:hypothetical protein
MPIDRREFSLGLLAQAAALGQTGQRGLKHFSEVSASLYAWDLAAEGIEPVLETLHETTGANSAYLVALRRAIASKGAARLRWNRSGNICWLSATRSAMKSR